MGRDAKRKKQARRNQRTRQGRFPRQPESERFSSIGHALKNGTIASRPEAARTTVTFLIQTYLALGDDGPACGGPLLVHADGSFQCTAGCPGGTGVVHVPEALHFCDFADRLGIDADELGHVGPACTAAGAADHEGGYSTCLGVEIDHQDGTTSCSLGDDCAGADVLHPSGQTCGLLAACERCGIDAPLLVG